MFKTKAKNAILIIVLALAILLTPFLLSTGAVSAESIPAGNIISRADMDNNLYNLLCQRLNISTLRDNTLLKNNVTELDLSATAPNAAEPILISSLEGLNLLDLTTVETLKINNHSLKEIQTKTLNSMPRLTHFEGAGNNFESFVLGEKNTRLKTLILDNNNLTKIDLSAVNTSGYETSNSVISLNSNKISSINDVKLPNITSQSKLTVNLINNNITDFEIPSNLGYELNLGVQGLRYLGTQNSSIITTTQLIKFYPTPIMENVEVKVYKNNNSNYEFSFNLNANPNEVAVKTLTVGEYKVGYYINGVSVEDMTETELENYSFCTNFSFTVKPPKPTFYFLIDGEKVEQVTKLTKKATLVIEGDENSTIYSSVDYGDWVEGNTISLTEGGQYPISIKAKIGDYESEVLTVYISANPNLTLSNGILILLICLLAAAFVGILFLLKRFVLK